MSVERFPDITFAITSISLLASPSSVASSLVSPCRPDKITADPAALTSNNSTAVSSLSVLLAIFCIPSSQVNPFSLRLIYIRLRSVPALLASIFESTNFPSLAVFSSTVAPNTLAIAEELAVPTVNFSMFKADFAKDSAITLAILPESVASKLKPFKVPAIVSAASLNSVEVTSASLDMASEDARIRSGENPKRARVSCIFPISVDVKIVVRPSFKELAVNSFIFSLVAPEIA